MIIVVCGFFDVYDRQGHRTGQKEFMVSHGIDYHTGKNVILSTERDPSKLGAVWNKHLQEWAIYDNR